jgi:hypothetical protein
MSPAGFEPTILASDRPQTLILDQSATGIGRSNPLAVQKYLCLIKDILSARVSEQRNILHEIRKRKANWIGHILRRNCLLKEVVEGKIKGRIEVTRRRGRRRKQLLDDLGDKRGYSHLKEEALDAIKWRNRFGRGCGPVVWHYWWMMTGCGPVVWQITDDDDESGRNMELTHHHVANLIHMPVWKE